MILLKNIKIVVLSFMWFLTKWHRMLFLEMSLSSWKFTWPWGNEFVMKNKESKHSDTCDSVMIILNSYWNQLMITHCWGYLIQINDEDDIIIMSQIMRRFNRFFFAQKCSFVSQSSFRLNPFRNYNELISEIEPVL